MFNRKHQFSNSLKGIFICRNIINLRLNNVFKLEIHRKGSIKGVYRKHFIVSNDVFTEASLTFHNTVTCLILPLDLLMECLILTSPDLKFF
jgi:hypothetical protein